MKLLDHLEKRFGHWAIPNVVLGLIIAQLIVYGLMLAGRMSPDALMLAPIAVIEGGEWWRLITFIISPPFVANSALSAVFLAFFWYVFWLMSGALEAVLGTFKFNIYLLIGILFTIMGAFIGHIVSPVPLIAVSPEFLYTSVFFAFAVFHPNFEFYLFFVLPVKVKWLAWFVAFFTILGILFAPSFGYRLAAIGPFVNFLLFFGGTFLQAAKARKRRGEFEAQKKERAEAAFHTCEHCGATDRTHPEREFRYKTIEGEAVCLCEDCRVADKA